MTMQNQSAIQALKFGSRRRTPRYALHLPASGADTGTDFAVVIRSISTAGISFESSADLTIGARAEIDLPGTESTPVTVIWRDDQLCGCAFDIAVAKSVVASSRLKGYPVATRPATTDAVQASVYLTGKTMRWPERTRLLVVIGTGLVAWAAILVPVAILT